MKKDFSGSKYSFCFSRWANKPFAVFRSLHKVVKIGVLCVAYSIVASGGNKLNAQVENSTMLEEATILAERQKAFTEAARIVMVIDREEIRKIPVNNLNSLLNTVAGIDVRSRGQNGVQADISVRGGTFDQVMILLNGVNITDPQTGHLSANIPVNLDDIDRIEVLKGSSIRTLGPGAFSGAINIVTGEMTDKKLQLGIGAGQHAFLSQTASAKLHSKKAAFYASALHTQSEGYMQATDFNYNNLYLQTQFNTPKWGTLHTQLAYQNKDFGSNSFYSAAYPNQFERTHTMFGTVKWNKSFSKVELSLVAYWRRVYDRFELIRDSSYGRNFHRTNTPGVQGRLCYYGPLGKTTLGGGLRTEDIISTNMGKPLDDPRHVAFAKDLATKPKYINGASREIPFYFIDQSAMLGKWALSTGVQGICNANFGHLIYGGMDVGYHLTSGIKLVGGVNSSLRLPTFTELYYKAPGYISNDSLKPERAITYELGVQYQNNRLSGSLSAFHRNGSNILDWIKHEPSDPWRSHNLTRVLATGIEADATYRLSNYWIRRIQVGALWQTQGKNKTDYISKYVLDYLRFKCVLAVEHSIVGNLYASWQLNLRDRVGSYTDFTTSKELPYPTVLLADLRIHYTTADFVVFADFNNLFNTQYVDIANVKQPGLWVKTGIQVRL